MRPLQVMSGSALMFVLAACTLHGVASSLTASPPATPAPSAPRPCPVAPGTPRIPNLAVAVDPGAALLEFFNSGGTPDALQPGVTAGRPVAGDVNGDGWTDWLVVTTDPSSATSPHGGTLWLFTCSLSAYTLAYRLTPSDRGAPILHAVVDLTGDEAADVVVGLPACGAHTCTEQAQVLVWDGTTLVNRLEGSSDDLPSPVFQITPARPGEPGRVEIRGTAPGSVGAGPYRPIVRTWSWSGGSQRFVVTNETMLPSNYRIHVLHDADRAYADGNYSLALGLYQRVVSDDSLDDWEPGDLGRQNLAAYASFRRVVTYLRMGDFGDAQAAYSILQDAYPPGTTGHAYAQMAERFWREFQTTESLTSACRAAQAFAEAYPFEILQPLDYGYSNPRYSPQDICPAQP